MPKISVLIPAYNEEAVILRTIRETAQALGETPSEIVVVDDGSLDRTHIEASSAKLHQLKVLRYDINQGKGHALRFGFEHAKGDRILFLDADMDLPPAQMWTLHRIMDETGADVVIGAKRHPDSQVVYPWHRRFVSFIYFSLVKLLFGLPVRDTQTGIKLFRREVLEDILPGLQVSRFAFDLELLVQAHGRGYRIVESPVILVSRRAWGRVRLEDIWTVGTDTLAIFLRTFRGRTEISEADRLAKGANPQRKGG